MNRQIVLDRITLHVPDFEFIEIAADAGYTSVSLWTLMSNPEIGIEAVLKGTPFFREITSALRANGLAVAGCEFLPIADTAPTPEERLAIETCAELGASFITATFFDDIDEEVASRRLAERADIAAAFGIDLTIEFMAPAIARGVCSLAAASRIAAGTGRPNVGVTADMLHLTRCGVTPEELDRVPPGLIRYIQLCDGPPTMPEERQLHEAGFARQIPGEGSFRIIDYLSRLPHDIPVGLECPDVARPPAMLAAEALRVGRRYLA